MIRKSPSIIKQDENLNLKRNFPNTPINYQNSISKKENQQIFYKDGPPDNTDDENKGYNLNCILYDKSVEPYKSYICIDNTIDQAIWKQIESSQLPNFGTAALKNIGENDDDIPLFKYVIKYINKKIQSIKIPKINTQDDLIDGNEYVRFSKQEKEKLKSIKENADITNKENVKLSGAIMKDDENITNSSFIIDDENKSVKDKDILIPTYSLLKNFVISRLKNLNHLLSNEINKNNISNSIPKCDVDGESMPLIIHENTLLGRLKGGKITSIIPSDIRKMINVEEGADKTNKEKIKSFDFIHNDDESVEYCKWVDNEIQPHNNDKLATIRAIKTFIIDYFHSKTTDNLKEGIAHKYFNNKTLDDLPDGELYKRISNIEKTKLFNIEENANVTNFVSVKKSGAIMSRDEDVEKTRWVIHEDDMKSESSKKVPSQKSVKNYIDSRTTDDIQEGMKNKYISGKSTDDLPEGKNNKYLNNKTTDNLPEGEINKYFNDKTIDDLPEGIKNKYFNNKTTDDLPEGKINKYLNNKTSDNLPEGKINKYFNNKTTDDLPEGIKNKYFRLINHNEIKDIKGSGEFHLNQNEIDQLINKKECSIHTHKNINSFDLKDHGNFNGFKSIGMCCDNGNIFPNEPKPFQWFLLSKNSLNILYQYDGNKWNPIISYGKLYISIDNVYGNDSIENQKDENTFIFKTVDFALKNLPQNVSDDIYICFNDAQYNGNVINFNSNISFKNNSSIFFTGKLKQIKNGILNSGIKGNQDLQGSITHFNEFNNYDNKIIYSKNNDNYKIIDKTESDTIFISGIWEKTPIGEYTIFDWETTFNNFEININTNIPIYFLNIKFNECKFNSIDNKNIIFCLCNFVNTEFNSDRSNINFNSCISNDTLFDIVNHSYCKVLCSKFELNKNNETMIELISYSHLIFHDGCILNGNDYENTIGILCEQYSILEILNHSIYNNSTIKNFTFGIYGKENNDIAVYCKMINNQCDKNIIKRENFGWILLYLNNGEIVNVINNNIFLDIDSKLNIFNIPENIEQYHLIKSISNSLGKYDKDFKGRYYILDNELYERQNWEINSVI